MVAKWGIHTFVPFPSCDIYQNPKNYGYVINKNMSFENYQTIGKPGEWSYKPIDDAIISKRRDRLISVTANKNIFIKGTNEFIPKA
jgi:hypothetical protein